jgi:hypothetical protein
VTALSRQTSPSPWSLEAGRSTRGCCTLSADGRTLVAASADWKRLLAFDLSGGVPSAPRLLHDPLLPAGTRNPNVASPALSHDQRTLYYTVHHSLDDEPTSIAGIYQAERDELDQPFGHGARVRGIAQNYEAVSGVSRDHLTLFMSRDYLTYTLIRASRDQPFIGLLGRVAIGPPGWRTVPVAACQRFIMTWTPGGCEQEDLHYMEAD